VAKFLASDLSKTWAIGWGGLDKDEVGEDLHITSDEGYIYTVGASKKFTQDAGLGNNHVIAKFKALDGSAVWSFGVGGDKIVSFYGVDGPKDDNSVVAVGSSTILEDLTTKWLLLSYSPM
jgi:hypothetical protein